MRSDHNWIVQCSSATAVAQVFGQDTDHVPAAAPLLVCQEQSWKQQTAVAGFCCAEIFFSFDRTSTTTAFVITDSAVRNDRSINYRSCYTATTQHAVTNTHWYILPVSELGLYALALVQQGGIDDDSVQAESSSSTFLLSTFCHDGLACGVVGEQ